MAHYSITIANILDKMVQNLFSHLVNNRIQRTGSGTCQLVDSQLLKTDKPLTSNLDNTQEDQCWIRGTI